MSISVVIPAYNAAAFIAQTIESVLAQTLPPDEVLVVDDGSTDATADIAARFPAPVKVFRRPNSRQAASRNFGVQEATSEWIAFVDADDLWAPNKLARQMEELSHKPSASLCYTARIDFSVEDGVVREGRIASVPPPENIQPALYRNTTFMPSSVVIRRSVFLDAGGFDTHFKIVEDWDLWLRLLESGIGFAACPEPLLRYRLHPNSVSHNAVPALAESKEIYRRRVLPHLPRATGWFTHMRIQSGQEAVAALTLRKLDDPRHLSLMTTSIVRFPFDKLNRYKILAHMLYTRIKHKQNAQ